MTVSQPLEAIRAVFFFEKADFSCNIPAEIRQTIAEVNGMGTVVIIGESSADKLLEKYSIIKADNYATIDCENAAVILGKNAHAKIKRALGVIVDNDTTDIYPQFVQLITCGISSKNTVSVTSRNTDKITVSLNRSVRTANGICEPLEFPISALDYSEYDLMAAFAAEILLGKT